MKKLYIVVVVLLLSSCASTPEFSFAPVKLGVGYVDSNNNLFDREDLPRRVYLSFPVIPGAIAGSVLTEGKFSVIAYVGEEFTMDMNQLAQAVVPYATPLLFTNYNKNTMITPKETRLLRVGTFAYDPSSAEFIGPTGIGISDSNIAQLFLVYFDRPATMSGYASERDFSVEFDVRIDKAGFSWLKVVNIEPGLMRVTKHDFTGTEFISIQPAQNRIKEA